MQTIPVGELKRHFSDIIDAVRNGEKVIISYAIRLGQLQKIASFTLKDDFKMAPHELLGE